ncbi:MAG: HDOD domain-containing protein [Calditrichaeota bacterium]|nr:MAG: HDOD domain-containing protein [Calditrichota bacterium]
MIAIPKEMAVHLKNVDTIATLPNVATEILDTLRNTSASMRHIAAVIEKDPSITTKILKVSNSPVWGFTGRVDNLQRAVVLLGLKQVTNIVISISLYSTFARLKPNSRFDREQFWFHSFGTAQLSRKLAKKLGLNFMGEEFVAGLIHDVGKIILDQFMPETFAQILEYSHTSNKPLIEAEKVFLNCTHADIGAWLLHHWHFPASIVEAVHFHHSPQKASENQDLAALVHLAETLCEVWGIGFDGDVQKFNIHASPAWRILKQANPQLYKLDLERFLFELSNEMEKAKILKQMIED